MRLLTNIVLFTIFALNLVNCNEPKNMEELDDSEDWEGITNAICKTNHSNDVKQQIEKCNQLDPYYKFDMLTKQCDKVRAPHGSTWYDEERGECLYNECYKKLSNTKEFKKLQQQTETLPEETQAKKAYEKYVCIRKALGLKVK